MVIKSHEMKGEKRHEMRGGTGTVDLLHIVEGQALPTKARLFSLVTLEKGCSIGAHAHEGETEIFYVLEGEGLIDDNGEKKVFAKGDCNICGNGAYHAVSNENDEPLRFMAVIIRD